MLLIFVCSAVYTLLITLLTPAIAATLVGVPINCTDVGPPGPANVNKPPCTPGVKMLFVCVYEQGCRDVAKLKKKNNLSFRIGPPIVPPKSFLMNLFLGKPCASLAQLLAFKPAF